ncbi:MAG TPA: hypothetical protein ENJ90_10595 [Devosia sp.]|nr:hypothetical protein [Devosia sp.]
MNSSQNLHATGIVVEGRGLLITGRSGSGKSLLALELLGLAGAAGKEARLVADDQVLIESSGGIVEMVTPPSTAGKIELRGRGIVRREHMARARIHLVVELVKQLERMLGPEQLIAEIAGCRVARCPVPHRGIVDSAHQILLVREALSSLDG